MLTYDEFFNKAFAKFVRKLRDKNLFGEHYLAVKGVGLHTGRLHLHLLLSGCPQVSERTYRRLAVDSGFGKRLSANPVTFNPDSINYLSNYLGSNAVHFAIFHARAGMRNFSPVTTSNNPSSN